ncbi:MAG: GntR family transcriptional regulator [Acidobacteria bacterium]|nr:GntR family transcriptional regulator [Acidobacteriota bacterium]
MPYQIDVPREAGSCTQQQTRGLSWLVSRLRADFYLGRIRPGDRLPPVRELARQLRISPTTALGFYTRLQDEGLVDGRERSGTYLRGFGVGSGRSPREERLFEICAGLTRKLSLLGVSPSEFARLLMRHNGLCEPQVKFGIVSCRESSELLEQELRKRLRFALPLVHLLTPTDEHQARERLHRDPTIRCLLTTYLFSSYALNLARDFGIDVILVRFGPKTARMLEPPATGKRYIITRDADFAEAFRRLACAACQDQSCPVVVAALSEPDRLEGIGLQADEVYASPVCVDEVSALYGQSKRVSVLPTEISDESVSDILFRHMFDQPQTSGAALSAT